MREYRIKIKYFKILIHKLWNKYFPIISMNLAEKKFENMDQTLCSFIIFLKKLNYFIFLKIFLFSLLQTKKNPSKFE